MSEIQRRTKPFVLSRAGEDRLVRAHPILQKLLREVLFYKDFTLVESLRTLEKQKEYVRKGVSKTLKSKHLPNKNGFSLAVDIYPYPIPRTKSGEIDSSSKEWDALARVVYYCAGRLGIDNLEWGGSWTSFIDKPHFQLNMEE